MLGLYEEHSFTNPLLTIGFNNEKSLYGAMTNDVRLRVDTTQKFEVTSQISEESQNDAMMLAQLLGWLAAVRFSA